MLDGPSQDQVEAAFSAIGQLRAYCRSERASDTLFKLARLAMLQHRYLSNACFSGPDCQHPLGDDHSPIRDHR